MTPEEAIDLGYAKAVIDAPQELKKRTRRETASMVRNGLIDKLPCKVCGSNDAHVHHRSYVDPEDIDWLCRLHHAAEHGRLHRIRYPDGKTTDRHGTPTSTAFLLANLDVVERYRWPGWVVRLGVPDSPRRLFTSDI